MKCNNIAKIVLASALLVATTASHAAFTTYFGENLSPGGTVTGDPVTARASFLSNLSGGVGNEDFESFGTGNTAPLNLSFPGSTGSIGATLSGDGQIRSASGAGRFATSGTNYWENTGSFSLSFSTGISAFGFYATDIGDFQGQVTLTTAGGLAQVINIGNTVGAPNGSLLFYGFTDTTNVYTSITFGNTNAGVDFFGFDDMVIGDLAQIIATPEPGMLGLLAIGLVGAGFASRRRKA